MCCGLSLLFFDLSTGHVVECPLTSMYVAYTDLMFGAGRVVRRPKYAISLQAAARNSPLSWKYACPIVSSVSSSRYCTHWITSMRMLCSCCPWTFSMLASWNISIYKSSYPLKNGVLKRRTSGIVGSMYRMVVDIIDSRNSS